MLRAVSTLGVVVVAAFVQGCSLSSSQQSEQVQDTGGGTYSVGVGKTWLEGHKELDAATSKAGDFCHAKGLKLADARSVGNKITFRCAGNFATQ
jgi:hypothetical protein